jgi:YVTN family beta-propeller protein
MCREQCAHHLWRAAPARVRSDIATAIRTGLAVIALIVPLTISCRQDSPAAESRAAPSAPASTPEGARLYVTNERSGDMTVIDVTTRNAIKTIPLGKRPRGIRMSPDAAMLYVALSGSPIAPPGVDESTLPPPDRAADGIGVVDLRDERLLKVISAGSDPEQLSVAQDGRWLFVANEDAGLATVVDARDGRVVASIKIGGEPEGVDLRPDGKVVYVTSEADNEVAVIDAVSPRLLASITVGARPRSTGFLPDSRRAYVSSENSASVSVVDAMKHRVVGTIKLDGQNVRPMGIVAAPDGRRVFVTTGRGRTVVVIDTETNRPVGSVDVGDRPWGIAVSADGRTVFTANGPSNDVSFVDVATMSVVARVKVGEQPWGIAYVP